MKRPTSEWFCSLTREERKSILALLHDLRMDLEGKVQRRERHQKRLDEFHDLLGHLEDDHERAK